MAIKFIQLWSSNIKEVLEYISGCDRRATPISDEMEVGIDVQITVSPDAFIFAQKPRWKALIYLVFPSQLYQGVLVSLALCDNYRRNALNSNPLRK